MDFSLTEEQQLLTDSAQQFLDNHASSADTRRVMSTQKGFDSQVWQLIKEQMGWHLTHIPEQYGGLGLGYLEVVLLLEKMGEHLLCSPFFSTVVLGINSLLVLGSPEQQQHYFYEIIERNKLITLAHSASGRYSTTPPAQYQRQNEHYCINGEFSYVVDGYFADYLIIAAVDLESHTKDEDGVSLFIVEADAQGIGRKLLPTMDQTRKLAKVTCCNVIVPSDGCLMHEGRAGSFLQKIVALAAIGVAAEQVGIAHKMLEMTKEYMLTRHQFGRAIGGFQALKHKAADMMVKSEAARSAIYYAGCIADEFFSETVMGEELEEAANVVKTYCCEASFFNSGCAIQMHGGIGFTWEYDIHLYFKRAKAAEHMLGDGSYHREKIAHHILQMT